MKGIITAKELRMARPFDTVCATDTYYTQFANRLNNKLLGFADKNGANKTFIHRLALRLTLYLEDIVADMGVWHSFSDLCMKLYGYPVPMYHSDEEYYPDEPSFDAVRYLIWDVSSDLASDQIFDADTFLADLAEEAFAMVDAAFEDAPINEEGKKQIESIIEYAGEGFNELRESLNWIIFGCYITAGERVSEMIRTEISALPEKGPLKGMTSSMKEYFVISSTKFFNNIGPLALKPYEWLGQLATTTGHDNIAAMISEIETIKPDTYKYTPTDDDPLTLENLHGKVIKVSREELNMDDRIINSHNGLIASFVFFKGEWRLNGVLMPLQLSDSQFEDLKKDQPDYLEPGQKLMTAEMILEKIGGHRLVYFKDAEEMTDYLHEKLNYSKDEIKGSSIADMEMPCMFIDTEDNKDPQFFAQNIEEYIKAPDNPYYNVDDAMENGISLLWEPTSASTNMVNYLIDNELLPDIESHFVFSQKCTHKQRLADMNFFMRFSRMDKY